VASLRPGLNEQNQMELEMHVAGDTRAAAVELVHRMEGSKHFQGAQLVQEVQGGESGSNITASVVAIYVPDLAPESASNSAPNSAANSKDRSKK